VEPLSEDARRVTKGVVKDIYDWFVSLVVERRAMARPDALGVADGRVFTGRQALEAGLLDAIGGEEAARAWLYEAHGLDEDLPVDDIHGYREEDMVSDFTSRITRSLVPARLSLDGLIAVWHPGLAN
jgi:protease-4